MLILDLKLCIFGIDAVVNFHLWCLSDLRDAIGARYMPRLLSVAQVRRIKENGQICMVP